MKRSVKWPYSIQWDPIEMFLLQTHLLFVTTFGLTWSSSVNIRWFWSIWKFPITAHPILCSNVNSLNLMKVVSPFGKNSIPHWASFWNQVMPFRIDGKTDIYNLIFLILKHMSYFAYACKTEGKNRISRLISALCVNCLNSILEYSRIIDYSIIWMCIWSGLLQKLYKIKKSELLNSKVYSKV